MAGRSLTGLLRWGSHWLANCEIPLAWAPAKIRTVSTSQVPSAVSSLPTRSADITGHGADGSSRHSICITDGSAVPPVAEEFPAEQVAGAGHDLVPVAVTFARPEHDLEPPDASGHRSAASSEPACVAPSKNSKLTNAALPSVPLIR